MYCMETVLKICMYIQSSWAEYWSVDECNLPTYSPNSAASSTAWKDIHQNESLSYGHTTKQQNSTRTEDTPEGTCSSSADG